ncbi:MAG: ABC transporter substrate-binding protein, partial [Flavobacteriales bacterium]
MKNLTKAMTIIFLISLLFSCIQKKEEVRIFVSWPGGEGLPHYSWKRGEMKPTGIEPAFVERLLEIADLDYTYVTDFEFSGEGDPRIEALVKEKADICIRALSINEDRKKQILFTNPYYFDGLSALVRKSDSLKTLTDLNGKRVYTLEFTSAHQWVQNNLNQSTLLTYEKFDTAFVKPEGLLLKDEIDAYILDKSFLNEIALNNKQLEVMSRKFTEESIGIGVTNSRPDLVSKLNKAMEKMKETGEFEKYLKRLN